MAPPKKLKRVVALDGHRLGLVGGMMLALVVMAVSFFYQHTEFAATGIRTGWAFVAGYTGIFFLVRVILRTTLFEFLDFEQKETKSQSRLGRSERGEEGESMSNGPHAPMPQSTVPQQEEALGADSGIEVPDEVDV